MSRRLVKVCGCNSADAVDAAIAAGADYVGLVFFANSSRNVDIGQAAALADRARSRLKVVGLFVDPDNAMIDAVRRSVHLDVIQLHGSEHPALVSQIRMRNGLEVWKAIGVRRPEDVAGGRKFRGAADRILYDAKPPEGSTVPGGTGLRIDWALLKGVDHAQPWGLAGGLTPANVAEAIRTTRAPLVDASSSLESAPGLKDSAKIRAFVHAARAE